MKKLFLLMSTPFWLVNYTEPIQLELKAKTELGFFKKDCARFAEFSADLSTDAGKADDYLFARNLPLLAIGANTYELEFEIRPHAEVQSFGTHATAVTVLSETLKEPQLLSAEPSGQDSFTALNRKFNLPDSKMEFAMSAQAASLKVYGRDLACDLLSGKIKILGLAKLKVGPTSESLLKLTQYFSRAEAVIKAVKELSFNENIKAALLGFKLSDVDLVFTALFKENTLENNGNWIDFGNSPTVHIETSKETGFGSVLLSLKEL